MVDEYTKKQILKELEQKKVEAKKQFKDWLSDEAYGRWTAFQEAQNIIRNHI